MQQLAYKENFIARLLLRYLPQSWCGKWPIKKLVIRNIYIPWIEFLETVPQEDLPPVPTEEIWEAIDKLIEYDEQNQLHQ